MKKMTTLLLLFPVLLMAQYNYDVFKPKPNLPRTFINAEYGTFRISLDTFKEIYQNRWNPAFQAGFGVRAYRAYYVTLHYGEMHADGKANGLSKTGIPLKNAQWDERWIKVGVRTQPPAGSRFGSYYGAGLAFFNVKEYKDITVFDSGTAATADDWGSGFYMELGLNYEILAKLSAYASLEISSGGARGRSGFEAMSIGGWRFSTGLQVWPF